MRCARFVIGLIVAGMVALPAVSADDSVPSPDAIRSAISRSIPLLEKGSRESAEQRQCFTCHNQAMPVLALAEARKRGFAVDEKNFERQLQHTWEHLERGKQSYLDGRGQGGKVVTAGYALWTLEAGGRTPDDITTAVASFLLQYQQDESHWRHPGNRPPSTGSDFTTTYVALRGLAAFGTEQQQSKIDSRGDQVGKWLLSATPRDTEDRVFRLWSLPYVAGGEEALQKAASELIADQREDGGWAQNAEMKSDAYATATVMVVLLRAGGLSAEHAAVRRGVQYLLNTQLGDGSWHVATRAKPFQTYYESGFPHAKDQFISITASSWSTLALLLTLPES